MYGYRDKRCIRIRTGGTQVLEHDLTIRTKGLLKHGYIKIGRHEVHKYSGAEAHEPEEEDPLMYSEERLYLPSQ